MNLVKIIGTWSQQRRDRRVETLPNGYIDIVELYKKGLILARGTGQSITDITAEIESRVRKPLKVSVSHGTYFVSRGNHQNMVTRRKYQFELGPLGKERIRIPASCINATRPIPSERDRFSGVARVSPDLQRFLEAVEGEDAMVAQAGIWALTDGYSRQKIQVSLRSRRVTSRYGVPIPGNLATDEGPAISNIQIDRAKAILSRLDIRNNL